MLPSFKWLMIFALATVIGLYVYQETHIENNCTDDGCPSFFEKE
tara:strand:- start:1302 stop:1433 length:132 start_codon:yes stop_codon:yes gene_type:complete